MVIGFDVDDVLCDMFPVWVAELNKRHGLNNPLDYWPVYNPWDQLGVTAQQAFAALIPQLYTVAPPFPDALATVEAVRAMGHQVVFLTTCPDEWHYHAKVAWLAEHGFSRSALEVIPIGEAFTHKHKSTFPTDYLLDDHKDNLIGRKGGVLLTRPHNCLLPFYGQRVDSLLEFANYLWQLPAFTCDARAYADYMSVGGSDF